MISISVSNASASLSGAEVLTRGMVGKTIEASFGSEWASLDIVACFVSGDVEIDSAVTLDAQRKSTITIPWEVLNTANQYVRVGFYGTSGTTLIIPTVWVRLGLVTDAPDPSGEAPGAHSPAIWDTKQDIISDLSAIRSNAAAGAALAPDVAANTAARHTHENKTVLDGITALLVSAWNSAVAWVTTNGASVLSHIADTTIHVTSADKSTWSGKLSDAPSDNKQYARKNGAWAEVQGGGGTADFDELTNRPTYNGAAMTHSTAIPEVKTAAWDGKQDSIADLSTIRSGAALGATALQAVPNTYRTAAEQDAIHDSTKQDVISDLSTIRSGAALGATALQSESDPVFTASAAHGISASDISAWNGKQDAISDLATIRSNASAGAAKVSCTDATVGSFGYTKNTGTYSKPSGGIPSSDMTAAVQTSLGKADTAVQPEAGKGLFSGSYTDLTNKPTIPTVPTDVSALNNDAGYLTLATLPIYDGSVT